MLSRGYQILYRNVCVCNGSFVGLNDLRVLRPLVVCPSQIATCCSSGNPWTCTSRNIVCFGQRAHWGTLVSFALVSLQCPIWPASLLQFTWLCRILQWMEPRRRLVCVSPSRRQKLTLFIRGPTGILVWVAIRSVGCRLWSLCCKMVVLYLVCFFLTGFDRSSPLLPTFKD